MTSRGRNMKCDYCEDTKCSVDNTICPYDRIQDYGKTITKCRYFTKSKSPHYAIQFSYQPKMLFRAVKRQGNMGYEALDTPIVVQLCDWTPDKTKVDFMWAMLSPSIQPFCEIKEDNL